MLFDYAHPSYNIHTYIYTQTIGHITENTLSLRTHGIETQTTAERLQCDSVCILLTKTDAGCQAGVCECGKDGGHKLTVLNNWQLWAEMLSVAGASFTIYSCCDDVFVPAWSARWRPKQLQRCASKNRRNCNRKVQQSFTPILTNAHKFVKITLNTDFNE